MNSIKTIELDYLAKQKNFWGGKLKENAISDEEKSIIEAKIAEIEEVIAKYEALPEEATAAEVLAEVKALLTESENNIKKECEERVENAIRLMSLASEGKTTKKAQKAFGKVFENQIRILTQDFARNDAKAVLENAITITPAGSLPLVDGLALAAPAVALPEIFNAASEGVGELLDGSYPGAKLAVMKLSNTGAPTGSTAEGADKGNTAVTMTMTSVTPLKVATTIQKVTMEQLKYNGWMEQVLKMYATKLLMAAVEAQCASVLASNSTAWDTTSGTANKVTYAYLENIAVAGMIQLEKANYTGQKVAFVNNADYVNCLNQQSTAALPIENAKIRETIKFVPSASITAGNMYVADINYVCKKMYEDVWVERQASHTHGTGVTNWSNAFDFIFDTLVYFFVTDSGAVVKLVNATVATGITKSAS